MGKPWEIQTGRGASILTDLGEAVRLRARLGPPTAQLEDEEVEARKASEALVDYGLEKTSADLKVITARPLVDRLMRAQQLHLAETEVGRILVDRIHNLEGKNHLQTASYHRRDNLRVHIVPLVSDAVFWHVRSGWPKMRERETRMLEAGEEREGYVGALESLIAAPAVGGQLALAWGGSFIERNLVHATGLVSPQTGEPQVELEVLARAG